MKKKKINICDIVYITKKTIVSVLVVALFTGVISITAAAETSNRAANIKSKGIFEYQNYTAVFDASDLVYLADEIDLLEDTYKKETVKALNQIGTYYRIDGTATHDAEENTLPLENTDMLDFSVIKSGIINSQSIPSDRTYSGSIPGSDDAITGNISAATAENLSLGTAAWVDGELIVGTGTDNNSYYAQGKANATVNKVLIGSHTASINTTSCSFDCTSIPGWSNLTSDNFSFVPTGGYMNFKCSDEQRMQADRGGNVSISYNNSTGNVTVSGLRFGVQTYSDVYSWVCLSGNVYCYVVSD